MSVLFGLIPLLAVLPFAAVTLTADIVLDFRTDACLMNEAEENDRSAKYEAASRTTLIMVDLSTLGYMNSKIR